jgi:hypothetical protein
MEDIELVVHLDLIVRGAVMENQCDQIFIAQMRIDRRGKLYIRQHIHINDDKAGFIPKVSRVFNAAPCAQNFRLYTGFNPHSVGYAMVEVADNLIWIMMGIDNNVRDSQAFKIFDYPVNDRNIAYRHKGLWTCVGKGSEPGTETGCENHRLHKQLSLQGFFLLCPFSRKQSITY